MTVTVWPVVDDVIVGDDVAVIGDEEAGAEAHVERPAARLLVAAAPGPAAGTGGRSAPSASRRGRSNRTARRSPSSATSSRRRLDADADHRRADLLDDVGEADAAATPCDAGPHRQAPGSLGEDDALRRRRRRRAPARARCRAERRSSGRRVACLAVEVWSFIAVSPSRSERKRPENRRRHLREAIWDGRPYGPLSRRLNFGNVRAIRASSRVRLRARARPAAPFRRRPAAAGGAARGRRRRSDERRPPAPIRSTAGGVDPEERRVPG